MVTEASNLRLRPNRDEPIPDDFGAAYERVLAERHRQSPIAIPSAEVLWKAFVEDLWIKDVTFAKRWNLKRAWRSWVWWAPAQAGRSS